VLHRNEPSGTLGGLTRVRQFSQDDAHIFLTEDQIGDELGRLMNLVDRVYRPLGLEYRAKLSTRPPGQLGDAALWDRAEAALKDALDKSGLSYSAAAGEGAFYGPKIDFDVTDSLRRQWQCATIQLDFVQPRRFGLVYIGEDNSEHIPVVIHRAIFGSFERFIALLIEHTGGAFPTWLAPVQAQILTVSEKFLPFAREALEVLRGRGLRVELDERGEKLGAKIREAELAKIPYALVVGEKETAARGVSPRRHGGEDLGLQPLEAFADRLAAEAKPPFGAEGGAD
jgi:threonyl-tRNA synthetase